MPIDFEDLDLSSVVDEMESMMSHSNQEGPRTSDWVEGLKSRVTASGFTESECETVSELPDKLTSKQLNNRFKLARDVTGLMKVLKLTPDQIEYCNDLVDRFSDRSAYQDSLVVQHEDMKMINTLSALSTMKMRDMASEVRSDVHDMKESFKSMIGIGSRMPKTRRDSVISDDDTVTCDDSASRIPPRISATRRNTEVSTRLSTARSDLTSVVVGGYRTNLTVLDEDDEVQITPVLGLPRVFVSEELNFLCHLHKPLMSLLTENGEYPCSDIFPRLDKFMKRHRGRDREPEANLLYMVIRHTFSLSKMQVKQNQFKLPMLEEGMYLDEELMYMCVEQLYTKFELMWFNSMKSVEVPTFHGKYKNRFSPKPIRRTTAPSKKSARSVLNF